jgi:hypothetical protein
MLRDQDEVAAGYAAEAAGLLAGAGSAAGPESARISGMLVLQQGVQQRRPPAIEPLVMCGKMQPPPAVGHVPPPLAPAEEPQVPKSGAKRRLAAALNFISRNVLLAEDAECEELLPALEEFRHKIELRSKFQRGAGGGRRDRGAGAQPIRPFTLGPQAYQPHAPGSPVAPAELHINRAGKGRGKRAGNR